MIPVSISHLKQHAVNLVKHAHAVISLLDVRPSGSSLASFVYLAALSIFNIPIRSHLHFGGGDHIWHHLNSSSQMMVDQVPFSCLQCGGNIIHKIL